MRRNLGAWGWMGHQSYLVLLESDLPYFAVSHEGSRYAVHTLSGPDPNDEVWGEKSNLFPYFPLQEMGRRMNVSISDSKLNPCPTLASAIPLTRHHSSLESSMTVIFSPGLGKEGTHLWEGACSLIWLRSSPSRL